jgi:ATPase family associated with various cellular activities (AAA)
MCGGEEPGMSAADSTCNAACLEREIAWLREILDLRLRRHAGEADAAEPLAALAPPPLPPGAPYAELIRRLALGTAERLVLLLALVPHVKPDVLDVLFIQNRALERRFTEFGGVTGSSHGGFLPTGETALFVLAGDDLAARLRYREILGPEHPLSTENVLRLDHRHSDEPRLSAALQLTPDAIERLTTGRPYHPPFSPEFPAQRIATAYEWDDLVLDRPAREEVEDIAAWVRHEATLLGGWGLAKRLKPGFRSLFYGPPGTGKTLTAALLGKTTGRPVYRVDLSKVVSKWIGETEKNLASLFDHAQHQHWILFFDEAEALFGKRSESRNANDRAANQQIAYLLQRIEDFPGIVILATNLRSHLDEAFTRRFQSMIHFPMPDAGQRLRLWEGNFKDKPFRLAADVDLGRLARDHEIAGGSILNVLRYACLKAVARTPQEVRAQDLLRGVQREMHKEGKFLGVNR